MMSVTVRDILSLPRFRDMRVLAGAGGIDNIVECVDVLESPEGSKMLQPRDMVITTIYPLLDYPEEQRQLFKRMHELGVSAIAIKLKRFIDELPDFMAQDADRYNIPILELAPDAIFSSVISDVSRLIINEQAEILRQSLQINESFFALGQSGGGLHEIAEALSSNTARPVAILSDSFKVLYYSCLDPALRKESKDFFLDLRRLQQLPPGALRQSKVNHQIDPVHKRLLSAAPIIYAQQVLGYIVLSEEGGFQELHDVALGYAATLAAFVIMATSAAKEKEDIIKYGILTDLMFNASYTQENIATWMNYFNLEIEHDYAVVVLRGLSEGDRPRKVAETHGPAAQELLGVVKSRLPSLLVIAQEPNVVILHRVEDSRQVRREMQDRLETLLTELNAYFANQSYVVCSGSVVHSIMEISRSYQQALQTAEIAQKINIYNQLCFYDDLDVYYIFNSYPDKKEIDKFVQKYLAPLMEDTSSKFDLIHTLEAYLLTNRSVSHSAQQLYIHASTMKYRLSRIRDLLDNPLTDQLYLNKLYMALTMYKLTGH